MTVATCPASDDLRRFLDGELPANQEAIISNHIETCERCQSVFNQWIEDDVPVVLPTRPSADAPFLRQLKALDIAVITASSKVAAPASSSSELPVIPGFEVKDELGRGGMGIVYRARHLLLGRDVAIKMLPSTAQLAESDRLRFKTEAETVARLQHPNIVQLYEIGEAGGQPYLVFEYVAGGNLQQKLAGKPQPPRSAAALVEILARAAHAAHRQRVIHRDLKPANVLLTEGPGSPYGFPKLTDFGLAKQLDAHSAAVTRSLSGTPAYMAPEQIIGESPDRFRPITAATDVYALGVILYEMLTGRPPFLSTDWMATLLQVERNDPVPLRALQPGTPRDLETICLKCLRKDPARRYSAAEELADDLRRFQDGEPIRGRPIGRFEKAGRWVRTYPFLAGTTILAVFAIIAAVTALSISLSAEREQRESEKRAREQEVRLRADAERNVYFSRISQAHLQWRDSDVAGAKHSLETCPPEFRNWEWHYLWGLINDGMLVLPVPANHVVNDIAVNSRWIAAVVDPDPVRVPGALGLGLLILWDANDGREIIRLGLPNSGQNGKVAFSPDGRRLVTLGPLNPVADNHLSPCTGSIWNLGPLIDGAAPPERPEFVIPPGLMENRHQLSANARWLVAESAAHANEVLLWDLQKSERPIRRFSNLAEPVKCVAISRNAKLVAACLNNGERHVWEAATGKTVGHWPGVPVPEMSLSPSNLQLAAYEEGVRLAIRDPSTGKALKTLISSMGGELIYSEDSRFLLIRRPDLIRCWDLPVNQRIPLAETSSGRERGSVAVAFSPECVTAATGGVDGSIRLWNLQAGALWQDDLDIYRSHSARIRSLAFSPDGRKLVSGGGDGVLRAWDLTRPQRYRTIRQEGTITGTPAIFFAGADGRIGSIHGNRLCWADTVTGALLAEHDLVEGYHECCPVAVDLAATRLVMAGPAKDVRVFDLDTSGKPHLRHTFSASAGGNRLTAISADGRRVAASMVDERDTSGHLFIWDAESGKLLHHETGEAWKLRALALSPDGKRVAAATDRGAQIFLSAEDGLKSQALLDVSDVGIHAFAFSWDGNHLAAVGGTMGTTFLWKATDGQLLWNEVAGGAPLALAFNPNGTRLGVLTKTGEITLWDMVTGVEAFRVHGPRDFDANRVAVPTGFCFSQDGMRIATADEHGKLFIWEATRDPDQRKVELRSAAASRALEWHIGRREVCNLYRVAAEFHQRQIDNLLCPEVNMPVDAITPRR